ncbi:hypothetical protein [Sediminibacterium ginsengisoli]|uniref:LTXXQ motif family protein n=1 Tax=Sediminibacterium ginsengisoli TaxID=413434 RepID=A0A1T4NAM7_9BACT|nr:hypothetical protein [Sediminibacterium ginsengisoli]SJZ76302.1 hypothetical protein SAMN04488132_104178 [Sediminibacterium ginsengisoli]
MKKIVLLSSSLLVFALFATAQRPPARQGKPGQDSTHVMPMHKRDGKPGPRFDKRKPGGRHEFAGGRHGFRGKGIPPVALSPAQREQAGKIRQSYRKQFDDLKKNDKQTLAEYRAKAGALQKKQHDELQGIYTDQQKKQIADHRKRMQINAQAQGAARLEKMKLAAGLSDEQVNKIKASQASTQEKLKALHENTSLGREQKREQMKALLKTQQETTSSVLTEEQKAKLKEFSMNGRKGGDRRFDKRTR